MLATLGALAWFAYNVSVLYLTFPQPWPDEALFADVSANLLHHGRLFTDLYAEFFPAMERHYYLTPPLYHVVTAGWFAAFGVGIVPLRFFSVLVAASVLVVIYALGRTAGLSRPVALMPVTFLALDTVFLRASLLGRMDLLALFFILLALWLALRGIEGSASRSLHLSPSARSFLLGGVSALAILTHPIGAVAAAMAVGWSAVVTISNALRRKGPVGSSTDHLRALRGILLPTFLGLLVGLLPWALYVLRDYHAFAEQVGGQLLRKASREWWGSCLSMASGQWGVSRQLVLGAWISGALGLALFAAKEVRFRVLLVAHLLLTLTILPTCEMWYAVYVTPLTYLGIACMVSLIETPQVGQRGLAIAIAALAVLFTQQNVSRVLVLRRYRESFWQADIGYSHWCREIAQSLPVNSTVLLDCLPCPYFGLATRPDLAPRLFPPAGFNLQEARYRTALERMDYIIGGRSLANPEVRAFAAAHGEVVAQVGGQEDGAYSAVIIKVKR